MLERLETEGSGTFRTVNGVEMCEEAAGFLGVCKDEGQT